jgi:anhydro-N-acetylmuramic acid kinase
VARDLYVGLMSGTSTDGVDAVLVDFAASPPLVLGAVDAPFDAALRREILDLNTSGPDELDRAASAGIELARRYAAAVRELLASTGIRPDEVSAIGCHGQTVRHRPHLGYTIQLGNPAWLAELTGIRVVADFRSRDIAAGGQGAPLVPAFHAALFGQRDRHRVIANLGGIANLTDLAPGRPVTGFDCGPANALLDAWVERHTGQRYDKDGAYAASGAVDARLLERLAAHPFFARTPPKSTGRDDFHLAWLEGTIGAAVPRPQDVQATLLALTVRCVADAVRRWCVGATELYLCGGGARNGRLTAELARALPEVTVRSTAALGVDPQQVEAYAFAWLARQTLSALPGNLPSVTGAHSPVVLGAVYAR